MSAGWWMAVLVACSLFAAELKGCSYASVLAAGEIDCHEKPCPTGKHCCGKNSCCNDTKTASC